MDESLDSVILENTIPIINYKCIELLSKNERQLSKFFKCCSKESFGSNKRCFWSGNSSNKFKKHIQTSHEQVFCYFCLSDNKGSNEEPKPFAAEDVDKLIEHMIESHGNRSFQCNRCQYRAKTSNHIQLHQISIHYQIWSQNNSAINYDSLNDNNIDICKIIVCKPLSNASNMSYSALMSKSFPDLDKDLSEKVFYCLFCNYSDEEMMKILMHCVLKHCDLNVSTYYRDCPQSYCSEESEPEVMQSNESESDSDEPEEQPINNTNNLVSNFEVKLSFNSKTSNIPGIDETNGPQKSASNRYFIDRRPSRPSYREKYNDRFEDRFQKRNPIPKQFIEYSANDFEEEFEMEATEVPQCIEDDVSIEVKKSFISHTTLPPIPNSPSVPNCNPIASTSNQSMTRLKEKKTKNWKKIHKLNENEKLSDLSYGEYRRQKQRQEQENEALMIALGRTSTPISKGQSSVSSQFPPEIDLKQTKDELGNEFGIRNNSFKQNIRKGVPSQNSKISYIPRINEEDSDEYLDLINKEKIPKRGPRARFENQSHFELITPQSSNRQSSGQLLKCMICKNETTMRGDTQVRNHLRTVHNTESSFNCGYCEYIGDRAMIKSHSRVSHPNSEENIEKFIVSVSHKTSIGFTSGSHLQKSKTTARKSTYSAGQTAKGSKGALTQRILESTYLGPLKNDVTKRKRTDSHQPFERVYNRLTHSSNIRPKKRQKRIIRSDSESDGELETENYNNSDFEMFSDIESGVEQIHSEEENIEEVPKTRVVSVAKKSTSKPSSQNSSQVSITLTPEQIPITYFCCFCSETFLINDKSDAIEHYKGHLKLGYTCGQCNQFFVSYSSMESHWNEEHPNDTEMDFEDNMTKFMSKWISDFLDLQIRSSDFAETIVPNPSGINIECPLCVKAAKICGVRARAFDALWKVKLHICKHLNWFPMRCDLCDRDDTVFPQNPYLLIKHLIDYHFTSAENLYNMSFRGQKPWNDMKMEQMRLIEKNFSNITVFSSDIINSFFHQLATELDLVYENQLKNKYHLTKEVQIMVEPLIVVKDEPNDEFVEYVEYEESEEPETQQMTEVKDEDKKDIKPLIKTEFKTEIKSEIKTEFKTEVKTEIKNESKFKIERDVEKDDDLKRSSDNFLSRLYGEEVVELNVVPSIPRPTTSQKDVEEVTLSSDDES